MQRALLEFPEVRRGSEIGVPAGKTLKNEAATVRIPQTEEEGPPRRRSRTGRRGSGGASNGLPVSQFFPEPPIQHRVDEVRPLSSEATVKGSSRPGNLSQTAEQIQSIMAVIAR